ncbi:WXG100 family type VII secretion target [Streptomyces sp. NPDC048297]|uniref:WXG100 family type VII secretion target n=1 Tax=Streptomyces sp. NPDC048297 TaxID=3365531 RepID=UPI0037240FC1
MSVDINGAIAEWLTNVLREIGDPNGLRDHADELREQAAHVRAVHAQLATEVSSSSWSGADHEAFSAAWQEHAKLAEETAGNLQSTADRVDEHADHSWEIVKEVIGIALEILEILAVGLLLSWIFAGITNLLWARVAPLIERIVQIMERYRALLADFAEWAKEVGSTAGRVGEKIGTMIGSGTEKVLSEIPEYALVYTEFYLAEATAPALSGRPVAWAEDAWQTALFFGFDIANSLVESAFRSIVRSGRGAADSEGSVVAEARGVPSTDPVDLFHDAGRGNVRSEAPPAQETELLDAGRGDVRSEAPSVQETELHDAGRGDVRSEAPSAQETEQASTRPVGGDSGSTDSHLATDARATGSHSATSPHDVRLEAQPAAVEHPVAAWTEPLEPVAALSDSTSVRGAADAGAARGARSSSASSRAQQLHASGDGESEASVRIVRPGEDEAPSSQSYRGPEITGPSRPSGSSELLHPENPKVSVTTETHPHTTAQDPAPETHATPVTQPKDTPEPLHPENPKESVTTETHPHTTAQDPAPETHATPVTQPKDTPELLHPENPKVSATTEAHPHVGSPERATTSLPHAPESPVPLHDPAFTDALPDVAADAARMGEVLAPRSSSRASREFRVPDSTELPATHKGFTPKTWAQSIDAGVTEGVKTVIGNLQTNVAVNHIRNSDQPVTAQQFGLQVLIGTLAGTRQTAFHRWGEPLGHRNEPSGSPALLRWIASSPISWSYYAMYLTGREGIVNGISGQTTPTEIAPQNTQ